jgi:hypothetical protein
MDSSYLALVELVLVFGGVCAFCWWQLRELNQRAAAREAARRAEEAGSGPRDPA